VKNTYPLIAAPPVSSAIMNTPLAMAVVLRIGESPQNWK
jgi:hypothetical protein